jgi:hypothetical protein
VTIRSTESSDSSTGSPAAKLAIWSRVNSTPSNAVTSRNSTGAISNIGTRGSSPATTPRSRTPPAPDQGDGCSHAALDTTADSTASLRSPPARLPVRTQCPSTTGTLPPATAPLARTPAPRLPAITEVETVASDAAASDATTIPSPPFEVERTRCTKVVDAASRSRRIPWPRFARAVEPRTRRSAPAPAARVSRRPAAGVVSEFQPLRSNCEPWTVAA